VQTVVRRGLRTVGVVVVLLGGCGSGGVTSNRIEDAVATTFANLISVQRTIVGMSPMDAAELRTSASCHKIGPGDNRGPGEWKCVLTSPGPGSLFRDTYDLSVTTDGCYTARSDGSHMGGPTLPTRNGETVTNLLYVFDGCFDTT
jgi:hypothetical protein